VYENCLVQKGLRHFPLDDLEDHFVVKNVSQVATELRHCELRFKYFEGKKNAIKRDNN
jgi:hypothetical protein